MLISAQVAGAGEFDFFEARVRPVLVEHCYQCHSVEAGKSKGGLLLDSREEIRAGGDTGPAVVPGNVSSSLLFKAMAHDDDRLTMPPKANRLPESVISDFRIWIEEGAPDPRDESQAHLIRPPVDIESGREFWAYQKKKRAELPAVGAEEWGRRDLDRFVLAKLESNGMTPAPDAAPEVLLRRVYFDVTGLPPSPKQLREFLGIVRVKGIEVALRAEVDRLLASEAYGERWGRHWLDVARYGESSGKDSNLTFPYAWRYRDYVIDSLNADKPYDRFVVEQVAGDLLPAEGDAQEREHTIATGFLALGPKGLNEMNRLQFIADLADEQIDTVTRAVMATSVACARCHDHKFDPYSMEDYYSLAGIFLSTETYFGTAIGSENVIGGDLLPLPPKRGEAVPNPSITAPQVKKLEAKLVALDREEKERKEKAAQAMREGKNPGEFFSLQDALRIIWTRGGTEGKLKTVDDEGNALALAMGVKDKEEMVDAPLLERGEIAKPREKQARRFPRVIEIESVEAPGPDASGRLEFAYWLTHPEHPLTARVMTNRVWRYIFGTGIVRSTDNFGFNGERPSHPELLDYLALQFVEGGWSIKELVRELVTSRAYRQASDYREDCFAKDPENRMLWRMSKRRLEAEEIRDAMLAVSGELDFERPNGSLIAGIRDRSVALFAFTEGLPADLDGGNYRSVYLPAARDRLPDVLELFDAAEPSLVTGDREVTNVPLQALYLMNSSFVQARAEAMARLVTKGGGDPVRRVFRRGFGRDADAEEEAMAAAFFEKAAEEGMSEELAMASFCQAMLATGEFRNLD
ncbi:MAG: PSD1 and planctomycete cytochrome C domain-containing protein [Verrucomicrobiota bacterium]